MLVHALMPVPVPVLAPALTPLARERTGAGKVVVVLMLALTEGCEAKYILRSVAKPSLRAGTDVAVNG